MRNVPSIGIQIPDILLPKKGIDLTQWAVIACDQFTSEPDYWQAVEQNTNGVPSTYHMILPEVFLGQPEEMARTQSTRQTMSKYMEQDLFNSREGMILVERQAGGKIRHGLMLALDLERYDFNKGSQTLIRATEGTILDRLPPRIKIRKDALLELPHILVLIDDPQRTVIEPLVKACSNLPLAYDFELMLGSGHLTGYFVSDAGLEKELVSALENLADPRRFSAKYNVNPEMGVLLFAMGDGNHSLATAKAIWEQIKGEVGMDHPARYALVEMENVHDEGLDFEPIHRVLFGVQGDLSTALRGAFGSSFTLEPCPSAQAMVEAVDHQSGPAQVVGVISDKGLALLKMNQPSSNLPVGTLQAFLDSWTRSGKGGKIDYVHGEDVVLRLGSQPGNLGFYLPGMNKGDLFKTVILDGALPRKTFSMGEAKAKRFYMECRKIAK
jgi:hypothetical protein